MFNQKFSYERTHHLIKTHFLLCCCSVFCFLFLEQTLGNILDQYLFRTSMKFYGTIRVCVTFVIHKSTVSGKNVFPAHISISTTHYFKQVTTNSLISFNFKQLEGCKTSVQKENCLWRLNLLLTVKENFLKNLFSINIFADSIQLLFGIV